MVHALRARGGALLLDAVALGHDGAEVLGGGDHLRPRRLDLARGGAEVAHGVPRLVEGALLGIVPAGSVRLLLGNGVKVRLDVVGLLLQSVGDHLGALEKRLGRQFHRSDGRVERQTGAKNSGQADAEGRHRGRIGDKSLRRIGDLGTQFKTRLHVLQEQFGGVGDVLQYAGRILGAVRALVRAEERIDLLDVDGEAVVLALVVRVGVLPVDPREDVFRVGLLDPPAGAARSSKRVWLDDEPVSRQLVAVFLGAGIVCVVLHEGLDGFVRPPAARRIVGDDRDGIQVLRAGHAEEREVHVHVVVEVGPLVSLRIGAGRADVVLVRHAVDGDQLRVVFGLGALRLLLFGVLAVRDAAELRGGGLRAVEDLDGVPERGLGAFGNLLEVGGRAFGHALGRDVHRHGVVGKPQRVHPAVELVELPLDGVDRIGDRFKVGRSGAVDAEKPVVAKRDVEAALFHGHPFRIVDLPWMIAARRLVGEFVDRRGVRDAARIGEQVLVTRVHVGAGGVQLGVGAPSVPEPHLADGSGKTAAAEPYFGVVHGEPP